MATCIVRSIGTGTYHKGEGAALWCNFSGQRRRPNIRCAALQEIEKAAATSFCKKCFPSGKPTQQDS